jgi:aspartate kinase
MIVMKFGGTSMEDANAIRNVAEIVHRTVHRKPVVVASACAGVTNALLGICKKAVGGQAPEALDDVESLRRRHRTIASELFQGEVTFTVHSQIDALLDALRDLTRSIAILGELTDRSLDTFASYGERLSSYLLYHELSRRGIFSMLLDVRDVLITDGEYTRAVPRFDIIDRKAAELIAPKIEGGQVVVTQGFIGATEEGITTTLGRGGSDYSAAILGSALNAEEIQIWTDVDGVLSCDPRTVPSARLLGRISFQEAAELAYFGAKVLHPATILPAVRKNIPVRVVNSRKPEGEGTLIMKDAGSQEHGPVKAIAFKKGITLIHIESTRMLMMHGFLATVFGVFAKHRKSVDVIATSEVSLSVTVDSKDDLDDIFQELREFGEVRSVPEQAIFCVVGERLKTTKGIVPRVFGALERANVHVGMVSMGASEINLTFVVHETAAAATALALHGEFFPS